MKMSPYPAILIALCFALQAFGQGLSFTTAPSMAKGPGSTWTIDFAVSANTDVEVSIVDTRDSTVVRHLAAGMLGASAPAPLAAGSLSQHLVWDGTDDLGATAVNPESLSVRVRAGMSVSLEKTTTPDPYHIGVQVYGVATDDGGNAYVHSTTGSLWTTTLRKYDAGGNYQGTVYPFPGNLAADEVRGYGINDWETGSWYSPRATASAGLNYSPTLAGSGSCWMMERPAGNELVLFAIGGWPVNYLTVQKILPTGAMVDQKSMTLSPALPVARETGGELSLCPAPGKAYTYMSGIYSQVNNAAAVNPAFPLGDTSFYHEGQVFKVNLATGAVDSFITLPNVPYDTAARHAAFGDQYRLCSAVRGVATDDSGRVFVCDRANQRVSVYDTLGTFLGSIAIRHPERVAVNRYNGAVYVMTNWLDNLGYPKAHVSLYKFSGWGPGAACVDSLADFMPGVGESFSGWHRSKVYFSLVQSSVRPVLWCAGGNNVWTVADEGANLTLQFDFASRMQPLVPGYDRLAVDRRTETAYFTDGWDNIFKIEDWGSPVATPCSTSANKRLWGTDMAVSPSGLFYVREGNGSGAADFSGPVTRYTLDHLHAPVPFQNSGTNVLTSYIYSRYGAGLGEKGLAVAKNGDVAVAYMSTWAMYIVGRFGDSTGHSGDTACDTTKPWNNRVLSGLSGYPYLCSPRYDLKGNLYVCVGGVTPAGYTVPAGFSSDNTYKSHMASVVRFPAGTANCYQQAGSQFSCAGVKNYPFPIPQVFTGCVCRSPRFDVDPYGRLFIPDFYHNQVTVSDNEGSVIAQFGHYGNIDSWGPLSPVPEVDIPLALPLAVAASEDYIYINDMVSNRMVRVRMNYALDNIPGLTEHPEGLARAGNHPQRIALRSSPNPFSPFSRVTLTLASRSAVRLCVVDLAGRLVRTLCSGPLPPGSHDFVWDAKNGTGKQVSAGIYVYRLEAAGKVFYRKTILAK